jgi:hypothetical protein
MAPQGAFFCLQVSGCPVRTHWFDTNRQDCRFGPQRDPSTCEGEGHGRPESKRAADLDARSAPRRGEHRPKAMRVNPTLSAIPSAMQWSQQALVRISFNAEKPAVLRRRQCSCCVHSGPNFTQIPVLRSDSIDLAACCSYRLQRCESWHLTAGKNCVWRSPHPATPAETSHGILPSARRSARRPVLRAPCDRAL